MRSVISNLRTRVANGRQLDALFACVAIAVLVTQATAQPANNLQPGNNLPNVFVPPGGQPQNAALNGPNATTNTAPQGASANADFDSLMDLITSTVHPETWSDNGGPGDLRPFYGGVLVDAAGTLRLRADDIAKSDLAVKRGSAPSGAVAIRPGTAHTSSALRFISLPRLEREISRRQAAREPLEPAMLTLAGLQRVRYVFVYPESGDIVLAGPAGDWFVAADGRILSTEANQPVVRLDDLLVLLRRGEEAADSHFGCSINPRRESLAKTQAFLATSSQKPLQPGQRAKWLGQLRDTVGKQDIEIFGIDPASRVAGVLVEADYHMKLIGMGLADGVDGVDNYLDTTELAIKRAGASPPPAMSVLRWWFSLNYETIGMSPSEDAFELVGQGVRVLSENELLAEQGRRVHTGQSDPLNRQFAASFTAHFDELARKYPVYGELRNIFDLAMAVALIHSEDMTERAGWEPTLFAHSEQLQLPQGAVPRQVETVVSHRAINKRQIVAGVSGGVMVAPEDVLRESERSADRTLMEVRRDAKPQAAAGAWWWDAAD
ncbi:MAG: DUF1598 domain-containing protein [Planctomycetes bacterium]|nr:DUF1598 domain-containing protein [Planctomycetota bacterium]